MRILSFFKKVSVPGLLALAAVLCYWFWAHPPGFSFLGYAEDLCVDLVRQLMAESLVEHGRPVFSTDRVMAPVGASVPFMSWSIERDWLGAYFWLWNKNFPFLWVHFGLSMLVSCLGIGFILKKMGLGAWPAWGLAGLVVVFHVPRHYKTYHHYEHLLQHWVYLGVFLDAWIWQRFWRERKWSFDLEIWRGFFLLGILGVSGYFWGPMILEWAIVRACLLGFVIYFWLAKGRRFIKWDFRLRGRSVIFPLLASACFIAFDYRWFSALAKEVWKSGPVFQQISWFGHIAKIWEPLWLKAVLAPIYFIFPGLLTPLSAIDTPETVITIGWVYWVPAIIALVLLLRLSAGVKWRALGAVFPQLLFLILIILYMREWSNDFYHPLIQKYVPFMEYFRVATRMGLFLPAVVTSIIALSWPELETWFLKSWRNTRRGRLILFRVVVLVFILLSGLELARLGRPVNAMYPMESDLARLLDRVKNAPGTTVLDLPFCVAGGNGVCTSSQCPNYPRSAIGQCLHIWHEKKVHGLYQSRMTEAHCKIYGRAPYLGWFSAWREQRCFYDYEWNDFCSYLSDHPEFSAVLLYPDIWGGAAAPACVEQFRTHLGEPLGEAVASLKNTGEYGMGPPTRIVWYKPKCMSR